MGTMRNNFATVFVLLVLMLSTSQSLPHGNENSSKGNSLADDLTSDARTALYPIYNCLFVDPDLPICDVELMLNSNEKTTERTSDFDKQFDKDFATRSRRNADVSATTRVVVYTIEGCVPARLPFSLPSCNGISLNNIVDVKRLRPFAVKGVTQSPYVFPEFDYSKWIRMIARLHNHVSSKNDEEDSSVPEEISFENSLEDRIDELRNVLKGSAATLGTRKLGEDESREFSASASFENVHNEPQMTLTKKSENYPSKKNSKKIEKMNKRTEGAWKRSKDQNQSAIPAIPVLPASVKQSSSSDLGIARNSRSFLQLQDKQKDNEIMNDSDDLISSKIRSFRRRRREIRLTGNGLVQGIPEESKAQRIAGKSIAEQIQSNGEKDQLNISNEQRKHSTTAIPGLNRGKKSRFDDPSFKINIASRKASWRRATMKDAALGKKHKNYSELPAFTSQ